MQTAGVVRRMSSLLCAVSLCFSVACEDDDSSTMATNAATGADAGSDAGAVTSVISSAACPVMVNEVECDKTKRPILFVHGTSANGDSFAHPAMLLASNGYCSDRIYAIEYNSLIVRAGGGDAGVASPLSGLDGGVTIAAGGDGGVAALVGVNYMRAKAAIDQAIAEIRMKTGTEKVDMLGHSQGSGHGSRYAGENPDKVARYVHLAGGPLMADPGGVPTLCLSSTGDRPVTCGTKRNMIIQDTTVDHSAVSSSAEAFIEIYKFFNDDAAPKYTTVQCGSPIMLEGRAPTLGDNTFLPGSKIEVYELGADPWVRGAPVKVFEIGADGKFGPWEAKRDVQYEFKLVPPAGDTARTRVIRAYLRPFVRSNRLLRFNFQTTDVQAGAAGNALNLDDRHAVLIPRRLQKAFLFPRDTLTVDGFQVISAQNTLNAMNGMSATVAAMYLYDKAPGDGVSSGELITGGAAAFVRSTDVFLPAMTPAFINVVFKESSTGFMSSLKIPNWPSATQGVSVVFVD